MDVTAGTVRPITLYGQAVLHRPCTPVTSFDAALAALVENMFARMYGPVAAIPPRGRQVSGLR